MKRTVTAICTGTSRPFNGVDTSAIMKRPRAGIVQILKDGFAPDEQADRRVHGGPEMAVHLYPLDHHDYWRHALGPIALLDEAGAFGSNLAVAGIDEHDVHIGDQFRLGSALLEISQPRQPCWKIEHQFAAHTAVRGLVERIVKTGKCGWYFRVIEMGDTKAGDILERTTTGQTDWTVHRTFGALIAGNASREELEELANLKGLAPKLRTRAKAKIA